MGGGNEDDCGLWEVEGRAIDTIEVCENVK